MGVPRYLRGVEQTAPQAPLRHMSYIMPRLGQEEGQHVTMLLWGIENTVAREAKRAVEGSEAVLGQLFY